METIKGLLSEVWHATAPAILSDDGILETAILTIIASLTAGRGIIVRMIARRFGQTVLEVSQDLGLPTRKRDNGGKLPKGVDVKAKQESIARIEKQMEYDFGLAPLVTKRMKSDAVEIAVKRNNRINKTRSKDLRRKGIRR